MIAVAHNRINILQSSSSFHDGVALHQVGRVRKLGRRKEGLLDAPRLDETVEERDRAGLVVRSTATRSSEGLLSDDGTGRLAVERGGSVKDEKGGRNDGLVDVEHAGGVAEEVVGLDDGGAVLGEAAK